MEAGSRRGGCGRAFSAADGWGQPSLPPRACITASDPGPRTPDPGQRNDTMTARSTWSKSGAGAAMPSLLTAAARDCRPPLLRRKRRNALPATGGHNWWPLR